MSEQGNHGETRTTANVWWLGSAVVIVLALVGLGFVLLNPGGDGQAPPAPATSPSASPSASTTISATPATRCGVGGGQQGVPRTAPKTEWDLVEGVALPKSQAGPGKIEGVVRSCFARTPEGALLAASTFAVSTQFDGRATLYRARMSPGPERDALLSSASNAQPQTGDRLQIAGFRVVSYAEDQAVIAVAVRRDSNYIVASYPLVWQGGDWLVDGDPPGGYQPPQNTSDLTGYIAWRGV